MPFSLRKMFLLIGGTFLFSTSTYAQVVFTVLDKATKQPVELAQASLLRINAGASTNAAGTFTLDNYLLTDTLLVSALGYRSQKLLLRSLVIKPVIYLEEAPVPLSEVAVSAKRGSVKFQQMRLGWMNNRVNSFLNLDRLCVNPGSRLVVWIPNEAHQEGVVEGLFIKLLPRQVSSEKALADPPLVRVRVCVLAGTEQGGPQKETGYSPIIYSIKPASQTLHIDLRKTGLTLPATGGFVGLEWLDGPTAQLPLCVGTTNSDLNTPDYSATWVSYRGKKWGRNGVGYGRDGKLRRFTNSNARLDAVVAFPILP